ncbi:MAG: AAA family ATPase [Alphaproteobacteria bacterium]|nr:AAA family ATPase [Alphaproteobacteria bacterium]
MADDTGVEVWLAKLGLGKYARGFVENEIDTGTLPMLTEEDLRELGLPIGPRRKILAAIRELHVGQAPRVAASIEPPAMPRHLADRILRTREEIEGERKLVTVLFADMRGSMELLSGQDPEAARAILDPTVAAMTNAIHRYEGTVSKLLGDGVMAVFGAPIAHEDHALRACYAALAIHEAVRALAPRLRGEHGVEPMVRIGLNCGEVVVRSIDTDLSVDYDAIGPTVHLAARMEQLARPGSTRLTAAVAHLVEGFCRMEPLGAIPVKGVAEPVEAFELLGATNVRGRLQATGHRGFTRFVAREAEMATLQAAVARALAGVGQIVAVVGEPGVGKSRLYHEFLESGPMAGWLRLQGNSVSHGKATPYLPMADLLRSYFDIGPGDTPQRMRERVLGRVMSLDERLRGIVDPLYALLDLPTADNAWQLADPGRRRALIIDALTSLFVREARERPVVVVAEDLHWMDSESLSVLDALVDKLQGQRLLMMVNFRPEFAERWTNRSFYTRIRLLPLPPVGAAALLDDLLGIDPSLVAVKRVLIERSAGNPFFLEECVSSLAELGVITGERGARKLVRPWEGTLLPASIQAILAARIDRLDPESKRVLQTASVIGKDFSRRLLGAVLGLPDANLDGALATLRSNEFVYETSLFPEPEYTFKHALTHDVAVSGLLLARRKELHAEILAQMEVLYSGRLVEQVEALAQHALQGEVWDKAVTYSEQAGDRAVARSAPTDAIASYEQGLQALHRLGANPEHAAHEIVLRLKLRDALFVLGRHDELEQHVRTAAELATHGEASPQLGWALLQLGSVHWVRGEYSQALAAFDRAEPLLRQSGDPTLLALLEYRRGIIFVMTGHMREAAEATARAVAFFDSEDGYRAFHFGGSPFVFASSFMAWALAELGETERAFEAGRRGFDVARALDQSYSISVSVFGYATALMRRGDLALAAEILEIGLEQMALHGVLAADHWIQSRYACTLARLGRRDEAAASLKRATATIEAGLGIHDVAPFVYLSEAALELGNPEQAEALARQAIGVAADQGENWVEACCSLVLARVLATKGEDFAPSLERAADLAERFGYRPLAEDCAILRGR